MGHKDFYRESLVLQSHVSIKYRSFIIERRGGGGGGGKKRQGLAWSGVEWRGVAWRGVAAVLCVGKFAGVSCCREMSYERPEILA